MTSNHSWQDVVRALSYLSYWQIFVLSTSAMYLVALIIGSVMFFPIFLRQSAQDLIVSGNPKIAPLAEMMATLLPISIFMIFLGVGIRMVVWMVNTLTAKEPTDNDGER